MSHLFSFEIALPIKLTLTNWEIMGEEAGPNWTNPPMTA
jgi:hypothetical protein